MFSNKYKYLTWVICLLIGMSYVNAMSNIEIHYFLKSLIIFLPIQILTLIYVTAQRWSRSS